jgi:hypothetical protein
MRGIYARSGVYARLDMSRGCPWWLYICSQLGFTNSFCLLLQVEVLGLVGLMYPLSGLLPWQELGRLISRTRGVIPSSLGLWWCGGAASARAGCGLPPRCGGRLWLAWPLLPRPRLQARLRLHATRVIFYPTVISQHLGQNEG